MYTKIQCYNLYIKFLHYVLLSCWSKTLINHMRDIWTVCTSPWYFCIRLIGNNLALWGKGIGICVQYRLSRGAIHTFFMNMLDHACSDKGFCRSTDGSYVMAWWDNMITSCHVNAFSIGLLWDWSSWKIFVSFMLAPTHYWNNKISLFWTAWRLCNDVSAYWTWHYLCPYPTGEVSYKYLHLVDGCSPMQTLFW